MKTEVSYLDRAICDPRSGSASVDVGSSTASATASLTPSTLETSCEALLGREVSTSFEFTAYDSALGAFSASGEAAARGGIWGDASLSASRPTLPSTATEVKAELTSALKSLASGTTPKEEAKATLERYGLSAEIAANIAVGTQITANATAEWKRTSRFTGEETFGLTLNGDAEAFFGAKAGLKATLGADLWNGFQLAFQADVFAGFKASATGSCSFTHGGETLAGVTATAEVSIGIGANVTAEIQTPLFGATKFSIGGGVTLGVGGSATFETEVNFSAITLAALDEFRKVVYLPAILKGYSTDLMTQDAKNLHYLNKCIDKVDSELARVEEAILERQRTPAEAESTSLLDPMSPDEFDWMG